MGADMKTYAHLGVISSQIDPLDYLPQSKSPLGIGALTNKIIT